MVLKIVKKLFQFGERILLIITYLEEHPGHWVYLSSVYNNNDHKIIAYKVAHQMTSDLVTDSLKMALVHYPKPDFVHSDMGSQYTSNQFE
ncbi:DDE-type integrase/transposase/recombinase [Weissella minor]|uniref:DDE-type integrase/transposase/recombinase n=1 Tax=Weissella minor TaxID=1620 RepID=UPI003AF2D9DF